MLIPFSEVEKRPLVFAAKAPLVKAPAPAVEYYRHGWQSWSLAAWTDLKPTPLQKPAIYRPLQIDPQYARERRPHGSWLGAARFADGNVLLLGALTLETHVFLANGGLRGKSETEKADWFAAYGKEEEVFSMYAAQLARRFGTVKTNPAPRVWCSWYSFYTAIDEDSLSQTFAALGDLPFDVLQIDDGWQQDVGDWRANEKFPSDMAALAEKIKSTGRRAGLWLAPLIATESSALFHERPGWFLRDERGYFVSAGFNWGQRLFALDSSHPAVQDWLAALMRQVRAWGFDYLKLDFLYAGALPGKRYSEQPRESAYRETLALLRKAMGADAFFLTCGTPILPALGLCDAMRVGPDVADVWENRRDAVLLSNPCTPGTRNAIRTSLHRYWLRPLLRIDPDVAYFESQENSLTAEQKRLLQDLALIFNFRATSDAPQRLSQQEKEELRAFLQAAPEIAQTGRYSFRVGERAVDFSSAVQAPPPPSSWERLQGALLGWLGSQPLILKIMKRMDDRAFADRKARLARSA